MGRLLDDYGWEFFEEPLPDADLEGYRKLAQALDLDVISGGNSLPNLQLIKYGLYGIGETDSPPQVIKALIESKPYNHLSCGLASVLEGEVLDDPRRLWQKMYRASNWHGRHGVAIHAISALDIALWDLFARTQERPLWQFFGDCLHSQLPAYATIYPKAGQPQAFESQISGCLAQGFRRIKICVEPWWSDIDKVHANLRHLRQFVGADVELMLDVAMEFTELSQLTPFIDILERLDFKWIEAPFEPDNLLDHRRLKGQTDLPLGVGDLGFTTCKEFVPYLDASAELMQYLQNFTKAQMEQFRSAP